MIEADLEAPTLKPVRFNHDLTNFINFRPSDFDSLQSTLDDLFLFKNVHGKVFSRDQDCEKAGCTNMEPSSGKLISLNDVPSAHPIVAYSQLNGDGPIEFLQAIIKPAHVQKAPDLTAFPSAVKNAVTEYGKLDDDHFEHINNGGPWKRQERFLAHLLTNSTLAIEQVELLVQFHFDETAATPKRAVHFCFRATITTKEGETFTYGYKVSNKPKGSSNGVGAMVNAAIHVAASSGGRDVLKQTLKLGGKASSSMAKYIPGVSIVSGVGHAAYRMYHKPSWTSLAKGAVEIGNGVLATVPGGTVPALVIDAILIRSDHVQNSQD
ncbi:hypothetical protein BV898_06709 [Hypsibius exemplaris]|uniref:Uncharacterized protein n=1 Tax=Hypsibius exemplaris TaxID=2072580 RepID=A0A1W0WVP4_HYPEX|nr:hypothetical protein BV898_06709 [Hypsibius exemplaris]